MLRLSDQYSGVPSFLNIPNFPRFLATRNLSRSFPVHDEVRRLFVLPLPFFCEWYFALVQRRQLHCVNRRQGTQFHHVTVGCKHSFSHPWKLPFSNISFALSLFSRKSPIVCQFVALFTLSFIRTLFFRSRLNIFRLKIFLWIFLHYSV